VASILEIAVNVALSLWFIQFWGIAGVAFGTVCAYLFEKMVLIVFLQKGYGIALAQYLNLKQHVLYSVLLAGTFVVIEFLV
jgi:Na+-driven multidrug efflux pump